MQSCKKCGASWNTVQTLDKCPFCGQDLMENKTITSIDEAFAFIIEQHGTYVFKSYALLGMLGDYAPKLTQERKLVRIAVEADAYKAIFEAAENEKMAVLEKNVVLLSENYFIDKEWARKALMWCLNALSPGIEPLNNVREEEFPSPNGICNSSGDKQ